MLDGALVVGYQDVVILVSPMSEEQLSALLAKLKEDSGLREKLKVAPDLDAAVAIANDAGFDVSNMDWLKHQAQQTLELSDEELEGVAGGGDKTGSSVAMCCTVEGKNGGCVR